MEAGFIDFNSILIEDDFILWATNKDISLLILLLPDTKRKDIEKILSSCDPAIRIILASKEKFSKFSNVYNLKTKEYLEELKEYLNNYIPVIQGKKEDILIRISDKFKKVRFSDIEYIQADGKYVTLNLGDRTYSIRSSLKAMLMILPVYFIRIHASYIVNTDKIESILVPEQNIELTNGSVPFSRKYKSSILDRFHLG